MQDPTRDPEPANDNPEPNASDPLLPQDDGPSDHRSRRAGGPRMNRAAQDDSSHSPQPDTWAARNARDRRTARYLLSSKKKHYFIMALVSLDVLAILTEVFTALVACDMGQKDAEWVVKERDVLKIVELVFSSCFLLEILLTVWAFGLEFFASWFHVFDAAVVLVSFLLDVLAHGLAEEIGSLVIILRLWRLVKIVEELSVGASERMEDIEGRLVILEKQNADLKERLQAVRQGGRKAAAAERDPPPPTPKGDHEDHGLRD